MTPYDQKITFEERDEFHRKNIADKLVDLLLSDVDISPMILHGDWGTGKTEFFFKTINLMKDNKMVECIYIDAFKSDM